MKYPHLGYSSVSFFTNIYFKYFKAQSNIALKIAIETFYVPHNPIDLYATWRNRIGSYHIGGVDGTHEKLLLDSPDNNNAYKEKFI